MSSQTPDIEAGFKEVIDALQQKLLTEDPTSDEFAKTVDQLDKLYKIKAQNKPDRMSKEMLIPVIGNLAGIVLILSYERVGAVTSKALSFVTKARV